MHTIFVGIDNGVSGSIGIIDTAVNSVEFYKTPVFKQLSYQKTKAKNINRIDTGFLTAILEDCDPAKTIVVIERPMINPTRFQASISAARALEATLIVLEKLGLSYQYMDSKEWQSVFLPANCKDTKAASLDVGTRLFPNVDNLKQKDFDSLLMAEYARRKNF